MKLKDCKFGVLVTDGKRVGMITGITNSCPSADETTRDDINRAIPVVKWSGGRECGIHHGNIEIFKG